MPTARQNNKKTTAKASRGATKPAAKTRRASGASKSKSATSTKTPSSTASKRTNSKSNAKAAVASSKADRSTRSASNRSAKKGSAPQQLQPKPGEVLGEVAGLMSVSPVHRYLFMGDLDWLVTPAIRLNQCRLLRKEGAPFAFVSWAFISDEVEERLLSGAKRLAPADWQSGEKAFLIDVVAPFGGAQDLARQIKTTVFPDRPFMTLEPDPDTGAFTSVEVQPIAAAAE